MALGVYGFGCEDALLHLMNYVWPNIFEKSPHMMQSFGDAVEGFRVSVGPGRVLLYTLQVREGSVVYTTGGEGGWREREREMGVGSVWSYVFRGRKTSKKNVEIQSCCSAHLTFESYLVKLSWFISLLPLSQP